MFRRALANLIPAVAALALLLGVPAHGAGESHVTAWATDTGSHAALKGALRDDVDILQSQWGDEDDTPDPVFRARVTAAWAPVCPRADLIGWAADVHPTHRACACPPRAPPGA